MIAQESDPYRLYIALVKTLPYNISDCICAFLQFRSFIA